MLFLYTGPRTRISKTSVPGGGVLPMWWVIHMCRGFDPLFSLWQDRARSFWGIFLIHQQQSYLLGYKNYQFLQKSIFLAPNSIFSSIFLGPIFSGQRHTPISFQAEYPSIFLGPIFSGQRHTPISFQAEYPPPPPPPPRRVCSGRQRVTQAWSEWSEAACNWHSTVALLLIIVDIRIWSKWWCREHAPETVFSVSSTFATPSRFTAQISGLVESPSGS